MSGILNSMSTTAPTGVVYGCTTLHETAAVITRTALAYSNLRRIRWWLAYLDLPLMWLLTSTPIVRCPELVVSLGTASTRIDDLPAAAGPPRRPRGHQLSSSPSSP